MNSNINSKKTNFCQDLFKKYTECLTINIDVFGKEYGNKMCSNLKDLIEYTDCTDTINGVNYLEIPDKVQDHIHIFRKNTRCVCVVI